MKTFIKITLIGAFAFLASCSKRNDEHKHKDDAEDSSNAESVEKTILNTQNSSEKSSIKHETYVPPRIRPKSTDDKVKRAVKEHMVRMRESGDKAKFVFSEWDKYWISEFNIANANSEVSKELIGFAEGGTPELTTTLPNLNEEWMQNDDIRQSTIILMGATAAILDESSMNEKGESSTGDLPLLLGKYKNRMPPTKGDMLLLRITSETKLLSDHSPSISDSQFNEWLELAHAKNPYYRMIALDFVRKLDLTKSQSKAIYSSYIDENEKGILIKLRQELTRSNQEWAKSFIEQLNQPPKSR